MRSRHPKTSPRNPPLPPLDARFEEKRRKEEKRGEKRRIGCNSGAQFGRPKRFRMATVNNHKSTSSAFGQLGSDTCSHTRAPRPRTSGSQWAGAAWHLSRPGVEAATRGSPTDPPSVRRPPHRQSVYRQVRSIARNMYQRENVAHRLREMAKCGENTRSIFKI